MTMPEALVKLEVDARGVAVVTIDNPPQNVMAIPVLYGLHHQLQRAQEDPSVKAIVLTGARGIFSAGFDVNTFEQQNNNPSNESNFSLTWVNDAFCEVVESGPKPTVAAIPGVALGGGCELSLACNARICTPNAKIGLPELQLGIIPGFGGTQRLPRLVGLEKAFTMMLRSVPVKAKSAKSCGLVDEVVPAEHLLPAAKALALDIAEGRQPRLETLYRTDKLPPLGEALQLIDNARVLTKTEAHDLDHFYICLDAVQAGVEHGGRAGLKMESECFAKCMALDAHKALVHVFLSQRNTKKVKGVTDVGLTPRRMIRVAVLGGGLMGSGIATALAIAGFDVLLKEINEKFLQGGMSRIHANLQSNVRKGRMQQGQADAIMARVKGVLDYNDFASVDAVIEAVIEDIPLKQKVFAELERVCRPDCLLATNTSTIDINIIGAKTSAQNRLIGAHFFSPAHLMPLLEIIRTEHTSKQVIFDTISLAERIKKVPVVVGNCTGFAVNRNFFPYSMAAAFLVDLGQSPYRVDQVIAGTFGMPYGPFRLGDLVGADVQISVSKNVGTSYPDRVYRTALLSLMAQSNRLGEKTGKGFYKFDKRRKASQDPELFPIVEESQRAAGFMKPGQPPPKLTDQEIIEVIFFPVVNEGCRIIAEGLVDKPSDLDVASIMGMGFPAFRGGSIFYGDLVGAKYVCSKLEELAGRFPNIAGFFKPCNYLVQCAATGQKLSSGMTSASKL